ncbi:MAG: NAD(P)-binding domain-containing protein [Acidobacteriota bacterium]
MSDLRDRSGLPATELPVDLLVVGAGPTGIAIGAEARKAGLSTLLIDRGGLCAAIQAWPIDLRFFTTRDKLEIVGMPFSIPEDKPTRQQALAYYQGVARAFDLPLALFEEVTAVDQLDQAGGFVVETRAVDGRRDGDGRPRVVRRRARAVALATGYFGQPKRLGVPGEELSWVRSRYLEPWQHFGQRVLLVGGGSTASETALDLWRHGVAVTLAHRRAALKSSLKYWLKPDLENRIAEGSIDGRFETVVERFHPDRSVSLRGPGGAERLAVGAAYVLIGYHPDFELLNRCGVELHGDDRQPVHDPETCASNVPGLYVAGTLQAGRRTNRIFIENSRDHGAKIVGHLLTTGRTGTAPDRAVPSLASVGLD